MAKMKDVILLLDANPANKALVDSLKTELGDLVAVEVKDLATALGRATSAEQTIETLSAQIKELDGKAKGAEALQATLDARNKTLSETFLKTAFDAAAKEHGVKPTATTAAFKLANLSAVKVDLQTGAVTGLTKEIFDGVRKDGQDLFVPAAANTTAAAGAAASTAASTVAPIPQLLGNANAAAANKPLEASGAIGALTKAFATPKA